MRRLLVIILLTIVCSGCALHYQNIKGVKATAEDIQTKAGTIEDGNAYFWSRVDFWFPWKMNENESL